jgi:hypothetical protein
VLKFFQEHSWNSFLQRTRRIRWFFVENGVQFSSLLRLTSLTGDFCLLVDSLPWLNINLLQYVLGLFQRTSIFVSAASVFFTLTHLARAPINKPQVLHAKQHRDIVLSLETSHEAFFSRFQPFHPAVFSFLHHFFALELPQDMPSIFEILTPAYDKPRTNP